MPEISKSSIKGTILGDAYYWAPTSWADTMLGAQYLSLRGWEQNANLRMKPSENTTISATYFGVVDRLGEGRPLAERKAEHPSISDGWHIAADFNQLTSLTFQEVFSPTFNEAVNSEVNTTGFATKNFDGFSLNFDAHDYKNFLTAQPETSIDLRTAPEVRFDSMDQAPWKRLPFYFGFDLFGDAVHRSDPGETTLAGVVIPPENTHAFVDRSEFAPRVTIPLHWGGWLGVTPTYTFRTTFYGAQDVNGTIVNSPMWRNTGEFSLDLRPAALERVWQRGNSKWKHTIEPDIVYNYVTGVNDFTQLHIRVRPRRHAERHERNPVLDHAALFPETQQRPSGGISVLDAAAEILFRSDVWRRAGARGAQRAAGARFGDALCVCRYRALVFAAGKRSEDYAGRTL